MATRRRAKRTSLTGNLSDVQRRLKYLEVKPSPSRLAQQVVRRGNIQPRAVATDQIALLAITNSLLAPNAVLRDNIDTDAIGSDEIAPDAVGSSEIATDAVGSAEIAAGAVKGPEIDTDAVGRDEIAINAVSADEIDTNAVGASELADNSVDVGAISTDAVGADEIALGAVGSSEIDVNAVGASELADNSVDVGAISTDAVGRDEISFGAISADEVDLNAIGASELADNSVDVGAIASGAVGEDEVDINAITSTKIRAGAVLFSKLGTDVISGTTFLDSRIPALTVEKIPTLPSSKTTGLSSAFTTCSVSGTGISRSIAGNGDYRSFNIAIATGIGSNQLAVGDHVHTGSVGIQTIVAGAGIAVSGSGTLRTIAVTSGTFATAGHGHGREDTNMAGSHVGHGGHTHFVTIGSSRKIKKEVTDYTIDSQKLFLLQPKRFKYKRGSRHYSKNREWDYGYIAEEARDLGVEEILGYDEKGEVDSINYSVLSIFVLELVKQQKVEIDLLKEEIKRLKETL